MPQPSSQSVNFNGQSDELSGLQHCRLASISICFYSRITVGVLYMYKLKERLHGLCMQPNVHIFNQ